jgi:hypothetical protein
MQCNFESAAAKVGYSGEKSPEKTALSCDVMLASQQKQLGRSETRQKNYVDVPLVPLRGTPNKLH